MRLAILDTGHAFWSKLLFAFIRTVSRQPTPEALKLVAYRPEFYGSRMKAVTHEAMRGTSAWSVGDRELMAAFVSSANESEYCTKAHTAVSARAYKDAGKVSAALSDLDAAPLAEPLRATLRMLRKLTRENTVDVEDMRAVLAAGRGCARRRVRLQRNEPPGGRARILGSGAEGVRGRCEVSPGSWLSLKRRSRSSHGSSLQSRDDHEIARSRLLLRGRALCIWLPVSRGARLSGPRPPSGSTCPTAAPASRIECPTTWSSWGR